MARLTRSHAHNRLRPHLVPLHRSNHVRPHKVPHELRPRARQHRSKNAECNRHRQRRQNKPHLLLEHSRILVAQKQKQRAQIRLSARIDDMVSPSQQLIHVYRIGTGSRVLSQYRQVCGYLAVKQGHLLQLGARKLSETAGVGLRQKGSQSVPVGPALRDPLVREDLCHGVKSGPEF